MSGRSPCPTLSFTRNRGSGRTVLQLDVQPKRAHLLDENVEALWNARLEGVIATHNGLIDLGAAGNVIRLDGEHFLQRVGGSIGFERPHLHFAKTLAAELSLAAQRLLRNEAVWTNRP